MSFNIAELTAKIDQYDGLARQNLFALRLSAVPQALEEIMPAEDMTFFCSSIDLPAVNIVTHDYRKNAFGVIERRPMSVVLPPSTGIFMVDSQRKIVDFFHRWMQLMINFDLRGGHWARDSQGKAPFEIAYKEDYVATIEIIMYSAEGDQYTIHKLNNAHPLEVGNIQLSWEINDQITLLPVLFSYDSIESEAYDYSSPTNFVDVSFFERFSTFVATVQGINTSLGNIQQLIDNFS